MRTENEFLCLVEEKIAAAAPVRRPQSGKIVLIAATVALLAAAAFGGTVLMNREHPEPGHDTVVDTPSQSETVDVIKVQPETVSPVYPAVTGQEVGSPETVSSHPWDDPDFPVPLSLTYDGREYVLVQTEVPVQDPSARGTALGGGLYALAGVSAEYFLLKEEGGLWGYLSHDYRPAALGDLMTDLNFAEDLEMGALYYDTFTDGRYRSWRVEGLDAEKLWGMLFANPDAVPQRLTVQIDPEAVVSEAAAQGAVVSPPYDPSGQYIYDRTVVPDLSISVSLPRMGIRNLSIMISREGWLWTNLLVSGNYFAVPPSLVDDLLAYAESSGHWVDTSPDYTDVSVAVPEIVPGTPVVEDGVTMVTSSRTKETATYSPPQRP